MHTTITAALILSVSAVACAAGPTRSAAAAGGAQTSLRAACPETRMPAGPDDSVYAETQVDQPTRPRRNNPEMRWPSGIDEKTGPVYQSRIRELTQGEVELLFVVDAEGCADMRTTRVISTTDSAFTTVVLETLPKWRFEPARKDGNRVAQLLQWKWVLYKRTGTRIPGTE